MTIKLPSYPYEFTAFNKQKHFSELHLKNSFKKATTQPSPEQLLH